MKVKINYDYNQQELLGKKTEEVEIADNTTLEELLAQIDDKIIEIGKEKNRDVSSLRMLNNGELSCIVAVNKAPPENVKYKLRNGDEVDILFGFCGG